MIFHLVGFALSPAMTRRPAEQLELNFHEGTSSIAIFHFELEEYNVYLIDTPGFDVKPLHQSTSHV